MFSQFVKSDDLKNLPLLKIQAPQTLRKRRITCNENSYLSKQQKPIRYSRCVSIKETQQNNALQNILNTQITPRKQRNRIHLTEDSSIQDIYQYPQKVNLRQAQSQLSDDEVCKLRAMNKSMLIVDNAQGRRWLRFKCISLPHEPITIKPVRSSIDQEIKNVQDHQDKNIQAYQEFIKIKERLQYIATQKAIDRSKVIF